MGGSTITHVAENVTWLLAEMESKIIDAAFAGLWPDSELIVIDPTKDKARIFKATVKTEEDSDLGAPIGVEYEEVEKGRAFHLGVAKAYGPEPKPGEVLGTIHVHS